MERETVPSNAHGSATSGKFKEKSGEGAVTGKEQSDDHGAVIFFVFGLSWLVNIRGKLSSPESDFDNNSIAESQSVDDLYKICECE